MRVAVIITVIALYAIPSFAVDWKTAAADAAIAGATAADAYYTDRNQRMPVHHEANPIARPLVGSLGGRIAYFSAEAATKIVIAHLLHKHHSRLEWIERGAAVADSVTGAAYSAEHYSERRAR